MSRNMIAAGAAITLVAFALPVQAEQRQLGPHEHGHGNLNIAIEGNSVQMELDVPGSDIVGFEHEANTPEQEAQLKEAEARLKDALKLFVLPASALCKLAKAAVEAEHEHDESRDAHKEHAHDDGARHREYNATYALHCTNPQQIKTIHFAYFKMFPNARSLSVKIVSEQRQGSYEVTAAKPDLDLDPPGNQSSISQNRFWKSQARQTARSAQGLT